MKEVSHKRLHIVRFHSCELSKIGKPIKTESRSLASRGRGVTANGYRVSFQGDEIFWNCIVVMMAELCKYT